MAFDARLTPLDAGGASAVLGLGCAPIGNLYTPVDEGDALATVQRAFERGVRFLDTAPHYGAGASEERIGRALAGVPRDQVALATKVGRRIVDDRGHDVAVGGVGASTVGDLSRDGILRSLEGSLRRLDTDRIDLLYLHDPEDIDLALGTAMPVLEQLRSDGVVRAIGVGMVHVAPLVRFARESSPDVIMPAGRITLLDRSAEEELVPLARERAIRIIAAGVFNSGILADPDGAPFFDYRPATADQQRVARTMSRLCGDAGVALPHVAAAYPLQVPGVDAVVIGARTPAEVDAFCDGADPRVPGELWRDLAAVQAGLSAVA